jgi:hypothetical protein
VATIDLVCKTCGNAFAVITRAGVKAGQKRCPACESGDVRQSFASFLRNGSLSDPSCGAPQRSSGFG